MKKLFISQPMRGLTDDEIMAARIEAADNAEIALGEDVDVIDSFAQCQPDEDENEPLWYLGWSLQLLASADVIYFAPGWEDARGCRIEHQCAVEYGIPHIVA
jgi:hypothetical protein